MLQANLGAAAFSSAVIVASDGAQVRRTERTGAAKVYLDLKTKTTEELKLQVSSYKMSNSTPLQVVGDDYLTTCPTTRQQGYPRTSDANL